MPKLILIAAVSENGIIGNKGRIPWKIPADMARFKELTTGHPVVMGRKTWDSLPNAYRPLPNRINIILTRKENPIFHLYGPKDISGKEYYNPASIVTLGKIESLKDLAVNYQKDIYVIGGSEIYNQTIHLADRLEITRVYGQPEGDASFPKIDSFNWKITNLEIPKCNDSDFFWRYETWERVR